MTPHAFVILLILASAATAGLDEHADLLVADAPHSRVPAGKVRITYLGVNGYQFETAGHALLVDPYFTRAPLGTAAFDQRISPDERVIAEAARKLRPRVDAVLVTHAHFDHLLDVPPLMLRTGARLVAGATAVNLARSCGVSESRCRRVEPGAIRRIGPWKIFVLQAAHDRLLGSPPFRGTLAAPGAPPERVSDWVLGEPLAFIVEAAGRRIYVDSGGLSGELPPAQARPVDLAILGVALPDSRRRLLPTVRRLRPRYLLPSHQDDFFSPLDRGFVFGKFTDFPHVRRTAAGEPAAGRLILLDYFKPWTLP